MPASTYDDAPNEAWQKYMGASLGLGRPTTNLAQSTSSATKRKASNTAPTASSTSTLALRSSKRGRGPTGDSLDILLEDPRTTYREDPHAYRSPSPVASSVASSVAASESVVSTRIGPASIAQSSVLASPTEDLSLAELLDSPSHRPIKPLRRSLASPPPASRPVIPVPPQQHYDDASSTAGTTTASSVLSSNSGSGTSQTSGASASSKVTVRPIKASEQETPKPKKGPHTPRPPNAWILYRSDQLKVIREDPMFSRKPQADISKLIGALWREEKAEVKTWYEQQAELKKVEHFQRYPEYKYSPQPRKPKLARSTGSNGLAVSTSSAKRGSKLASSQSTVASDDGASSLARSTSPKRTVKAPSQRTSTYYPLPIIEAQPLSSFYSGFLGESTTQPILSDPPSPSPHRLQPFDMPIHLPAYELYSPSIGVQDGYTPSPTTAEGGFFSPLLTGSSYADAFALTPTASTMSLTASTASSSNALRTSTASSSPSAHPIASAAEIDALLAALGTPQPSGYPGLGVLTQDSAAGDEAWTAFFGNRFTYAANLDGTLSHRLASSTYLPPAGSSSSSVAMAAGPSSDYLGPETFDLGDLEGANEGCEWLAEPYEPGSGGASQLPWLEDDPATTEAQWGRAL